MNPDDPIRTEGEWITQVRGLRRALQTDDGHYVFWTPAGTVEAVEACLEPQERARVTIVDYPSSKSKEGLEPYYNLYPQKFWS